MREHLLFVSLEVVVPQSDNSEWNVENRILFYLTLAAFRPNPDYRPQPYPAYALSQNIFFQKPLSLAFLSKLSKLMKKVIS